MRISVWLLWLQRPSADVPAFCCAHQQSYTDYTGEGSAPEISCRCGGTTVSTGSYCEYGNQRSVLLFFWLVTGLWGVAVLRSVVTATVSGSAASWWFSARERGRVRGAFSRATHGSLG